MSYLLDLESIDWPSLETAYGSAEPIPSLLTSVLSTDDNIALNAAAELEGYLCHQHVQLHNGSEAALPFILEALTKTSSQVSEKLLFVILGYALATEDGFWIERPDWMNTVTQLLCNSIHLLEMFKISESQDSVNFANNIISLLKKIVKEQPNKNKHNALAALGRVLRPRPCYWRYDSVFKGI